MLLASVFTGCWTVVGAAGEGAFDSDALASGLPADADAGLIADVATGFAGATGDGGGVVPNAAYKV